MDTEKNSNISPLVIHLLKGVLYRDRDHGLWQDLLTLLKPLADYISVMGLKCIIDDNEGYAYLKQTEEFDEESALPRLVQRRPLSYTVSLLCVLLRKKMVESDAGGESSRVILTRNQIIDTMRVNMPDMNNEVKLIDHINKAIRRITELGFLRPFNKEEDRFEVRRILRAFIDADFISSLDEKIEEYRKYNSESE